MIDPRRSRAPEIKAEVLRSEARKGERVLKSRTVTDILGHADPAMTLERYAPVLPE
jgi:hypothetical protein